MILVDTSIWIDHFRHGLPTLELALESEQVLMHPWIVGELSLGNLRNREQILTYLQQLPETLLATTEEVQKLIRSARLFGRGIGFIDAQLLASARLTPGTTLWTADRRLHACAIELGVAWSPAA